MDPVITADGTVTGRDVETGELYHNLAGCRQEALLQYFHPSRVGKVLRETGRFALLDVFFGMGYNTFTLIDAVLAEAPDRFTLDITAIERDPAVLSLLPQILAQTAFPNIPAGAFFDGQCQVVAGDVLTVCWTPVPGQSIRLTLHVADARMLVPELANAQAGTYDAVFHDPFSPARVPSLWTIDFFQAYATLLNRPAGRLLTYSAAGAVRGALAETGFSVYKSAPLGQKLGGSIGCFPETLPDTDDASDAVSRLYSLTEAERAYIASKAGIPYRDASYEASHDAVRKSRAREQAGSPRISGAGIRDAFFEHFDASAATAKP